MSTMLTPKPTRVARNNAAQLRSAHTQLKMAVTALHGKKTDLAQQACTAMADALSRFEGRTASGVSRHAFWASMAQELSTLNIAELEAVAEGLKALETQLDQEDVKGKTKVNGTLNGVIAQLKFSVHAPLLELKMDALDEQRVHRYASNWHASLGKAMLDLNGMADLVLKEARAFGLEEGATLPGTTVSTTQLVSAKKKMEGALVAIGANAGRVVAESHLRTAQKTLAGLKTLNDAIAFLQHPSSPASVDPEVVTLLAAQVKKAEGDFVRSEFGAGAHKIKPADMSHADLAALYKRMAEWPYVPEQLAGLKGKTDAAMQNRKAKAGAEIQAQLQQLSRDTTGDTTELLLRASVLVARHAQVFEALGASVSGELSVWIQKFARDESVGHAKGLWHLQYSLTVGDGKAIRDVLGTLNVDRIKPAIEFLELLTLHTNVALQTVSTPAPKKAVAELSDAARNALMRHLHVAVAVAPHELVDGAGFVSTWQYETAAALKNVRQDPMGKEDLPVEKNAGRVGNLTYCIQGLLRVAVEPEDYAYLAQLKPLAAALVSAATRLRDEDRAADAKEMLANLEAALDTPRR
ncbi:hypothetical protein [Hydrogenophaga sp. BPS33]|uniref:hypothetical protein n=1 Tax=Hydrogenophaga sp. BPS33 TaxID=2651974 RepID=UPI00132001E5|nr:hypothetical protein [Hydrogenophaga sp. BPS33]QHE88442.1 hypothetical protein F9K07_27945 [Hydrogenophaga sp. BPS33]